MKSLTGVESSLTLAEQGVAGFQYSNPEGITAFPQAIDEEARVKFPNGGAHDPEWSVQLGRRAAIMAAATMGETVQLVA